MDVATTREEWEEAGVACVMLLADLRHEDLMHCIELLGGIIPAPRT